MNKAYKFRLYPNAEQMNLLTRTFGCVRFIYNKMLGDKIDYYHETGKKLSNTPAQYKEEFPWLKEEDSLALANAQLQHLVDPKCGAKWWEYVTSVNYELLTISIELVVFYCGMR